LDKKKGRRSWIRAALRPSELPGEKGVAILADLFIATDDLSYIFNQDRCYEQNRRYEDAIGRFREYLIKGDKLKPDERADAEKHIAACQSHLGKTEPRAPAVQGCPVNSDKRTGRSSKGLVYAQAAWAFRRISTVWQWNLKAELV
jgi:hypothetical protein